MTKAFYVYIGSLLSALFCLTFWHNCVAYTDRTWTFKVTKSVIDWSLISFLAWKLPSLLVAWAVNWATWPIRDRNVRVTLSVFSGIAFNALSMNVIEMLCLCSIFSIDIITGNNGFLKQLELSKREARTV